MKPKNAAQIPMNPKLACRGVQAESARSGRNIPPVSHFCRPS
jgi:hypothetical protein